MSELSKMYMPFYLSTGVVRPFHWSGQIFSQKWLGLITPVIRSNHFCGKVMSIYEKRHPPWMPPIFVVSFPSLNSSYQLR